MLWGSGLNVGWMILGSLMMLLLWAGLIALVILAWRAFVHSGSGQAATPRARPQTGDRALDVLKERYARGEISSDQYEALQADLIH